MEEILGTLESDYKKQALDMGQYFLVTNMMEKITDHLTGHYAQVRKELDTIMGGKILEFKGERLYRKAVTEGREQGAVLTLVGLVKEGALPKEFAIKRAEEKYGVSAEKFKELLAATDAEDERLQG